ncbi:MAG: hypothetical protein JW936_08030 [Sedimentisphaerales bacterium]|nr:hypothetical protein [Sedimentisphaerales bacterium]
MQQPHPGYNLPPFGCPSTVQIATILIISICAITLAQTTITETPNIPATTENLTYTEEITPPITLSQESVQPQPAQAVVITVDGMIDDGLYESIKRRTEEAIDNGATYIIYQIDTYGGALIAAFEICNYLMLDVSPRVHTVAYVPTKAISAGVMISVACNDIVMKRGTTMGDCAPISATGQAIEGVEREKIESPTRALFRNAAEANGYPSALCEAFVTIGHQVYQVRNLQTHQYEYFESDDLPTDPCAYDLANQKLIVDDDELLTVKATEALELGLCRVILDEPIGTYSEILAFFENRDNVVFAGPPTVLRPNWSEQMVRFLTSPIVAGLLTLVALLGIYAELNSPGLGLPGAVAVAALAILFGSKFMIGLANWWEIALFVIGIVLLLIEIFVIPGFGIAGISGLILILFSLVAMMIPNSPSEWPIPQTPFDWELFQENLIYTMLGIFAFFICAYFLGKYFPRLPIANRLVLVAPQKTIAVPPIKTIAPAPELPVKIGDVGVTLSQLRPAGKAKFGKIRLDVVTQGNLVENNQQIKVVAIDGNSIVVKEIS